jgi:tripartite-type tricarboxylate transporter receptor subunit TctC
MRRANGSSTIECEALADSSLMEETSVNRIFRQSVLAATLLLSASFGAAAQDYPNRAVKLVVPYPAGGATDILGRQICAWLQEKLGQTFIVENKPGAGNNLGTEQVVNSPADGYTMLLVNPAHGINATLYPSLSFNFIRDIAPVAGLIRVPNVMVVHPSVPAKTVSEFIAWAKSNPGKVNMASSGSGTSIHLSGELFKSMTGVNMVHVPYRGSAPALTDLLGGQVQVMFDNLPASIGHIKEGRLRPLAVTTASRNEALPDVPTVGDTVSGYEASAWFGLGMPKGSPQAAIDRINKEVNAALADPKFLARMKEMGGVPIGGSPSDFAKIIQAETDKWSKVVKESGAKVE